MKRLRELFVRAGFQTSSDQWQLQVDAAVQTTETSSQEPGDFDTLHECRAVSFSTSCDLVHVSVKS